MNKFRTHTHRVMGNCGICPIHIIEDSCSLNIVTVYDPENEDDWECHDIMYIPHGEVAPRAVYHGPPPVHVLRYQDIPTEDPWSPYYNREVSP